MVKYGISNGWIPMGRLELNDLVKVFESGDSEIVAVDDLDVTVDDGDLLVLVGPSGCGKSTTLRCIAGLERVTSGRIELDGRDITHSKPKERDMAMVFQNYALYPHMSVRKNIGYGLKITTDLDKSAVYERVEETAEMLEIGDLLDKKPSELSGGQQQRVALGRAIIREPEVFLMDEPLSNLDAKLRTTMRTEIQQLQQEMDVTTIYVTHDQTEAMTMGDYIAVLDDGELQQLGTPLECYHEPRNRFVAGFIGSPSMNFLEVERGGNVLHHDEFTYQLSSETVDAVAMVTSGIRPGVVGAMWGWGRTGDGATPETIDGETRSAAEADGHSDYQFDEPMTEEAGYAKGRDAGFAINHIQPLDEELGDTGLSDLVGGSNAQYDAFVDVERR